MTERKIIIVIACMLAMLSSCTDGKRWVVAVSQCSMDEWRDQMNEEMRREAFFHPDLDIEYHSSADNSEQQIRDIESFIQRGVDLIVVAPNEEEPLTPVIEKAYDAGIHVVLIDRRVNTDKYTAYVGGDNEEVGRQAARYILGKYPHGGSILEIEGLKSSSASQERKRGFHEVMDSHPEINILADLTADWQRRKAKSLLEDGNHSWSWDDVNTVFAYNDRMAIGAWEAAGGRGNVCFIGVDALPNDTIGIGRIEDGTLDASFLYPTGGDKAIHTAACILNGQPFSRDQVMQTSIVDRSNVHLMKLQAAHISEQNVKIEFLNGKLDRFFKEYSAQKALLYTIVIVFVIICILLVLCFRAYLVKHRLNAELRRQSRILEQQRDELAEQKETVERQRDMLEVERDKLMEQSLAIGGHTTEPSSSGTAVQTEPAEETDTQEEGWNDHARDNLFLQRFDEVLEQNLSNADLTVDMLAAEMMLGRVQLYRRVKMLTGMSPNEMLRTVRLNKAYKMLQKSGLTVSEVAYAVGFSSPSYFAKCYKDQFGRTPSCK